MALVPAKCPECGGNINIDPEKKAGICEYCKQPFVVQEAIQNFNTTYNVTNNNEIKADVVNVYENKETDFVIRAGTLTKYCGSDANVIIPNEVKRIGKKAFEGMSIEYISIGENVTIIEENAFKGCNILREVNFGKSVKEVQRWAFFGCDNLEIMHLSSSLRNMDPEIFGHFGERGVKEIIAPDDLELQYYAHAFPNQFHNEIVEIGANIARDKNPIGCFSDNYSVNSYGDAEWKTLDYRHNTQLWYINYFLNYSNDSITIGQKNGDYPNYIQLYGHYGREYKRLLDSTSIKFAFFKECFTSKEQIDAYFSENYRKKGICPFCKRKLNIFGKCKYCNQ